MKGALENVEVLHFFLYLSFVGRSCSPPPPSLQSQFWDKLHAGVGGGGGWTTLIKPIGLISGCGTAADRHCRPASFCLSSSLPPTPSQPGWQRGGGEGFRLGR